jgi:gliding-associated putative ABC transporter substrate-binding component GldG
MALERKTYAKGENALFLVVLAAILVVANVLAVRFFTRADMTARKIYSLSDASRRIAGRLRDRLVVKAYFTEDLPAPFNAHARYVRDILEEYEAYSNGKMSIQFIDPGEDTAKQEQAQKLGIEKVRHRVVKREQASTVDGYRGIAFTYLGETEAIPVVQDTVGLEYEITSVLKRLMRERQSIGVLQGHDEPTFDKGLKILQSSLTGYTVRPVDLSAEGTRMPEDIKAMLVIGPQKRLAEHELYELDQFVMRGGALGVFVDGVKVDMSTPQLGASVLDSGINDLLDPWGIKIRDDLVLDAQSGRVPARAPGRFPMPVLVPYPPWPRSDRILKSHPVAFRLPQLTVPFGSSIGVKPEARRSKQVRYKTIVQSTENSWRQRGTFNLDPFQEWTKGRDHGPFALVVAAEGRFRSGWVGKQSPFGPQPAESSDEGGPPPKLDECEHDGRLLVVGSSQIANDQILSLLQRMEQAEKVSNLTFLLNAVDYLTQEQGLIAIRAKQVEDPEIRQITDGKKIFAKWANILGLPILFAGFGIVRWKARQRARANVSLS